MKNLLAILLALFFCCQLSAQSPSEIKDLIQELPETDSLEKDIHTLWGILGEDPSTLKPHKKALTRGMNLLLSQKSSPFNVFHFALELCNEDILTIQEEADQHIVATEVGIREFLKQDADYQTWIWDDSIYSDVRYQAGVLLDLMGHLNSKASTQELRTSLQEFYDARLKFFAVKSLLEKGEKVQASQIHPIAAEDETRELLFDLLERHELLTLFPKAYLTQEALARSNMVVWLIYPTELGHPPTEIELWDTINITYNDVGKTTYYLWKFRSDAEAWKEDGWMVGLSGPYVNKEMPTTRSYGYTFSQFSKLEEKSPEEHFEYIMDILNKSEEDKKE
ncbi:MAG: hypothetical protein AAF696_11495 [Bacteroidota bacterium]